MGLKKALKLIEFQKDVIERQEKVIQTQDKMINLLQKRIEEVEKLSKENSIPSFVKKDVKEEPKISGQKKGHEVYV